MNEALQKARTRLLLSHPFFGCLLLQSKFEVDNSLTDIATDGRDLWYSEEAFEKKPYQEIMGIIAHGLGHKMFLHPSRIGDRDPKLWEQATDYALNNVLEQSGFMLPEDYLRDSEYNEMSAEQIYVKLQEQQQQQSGGQGGGQGGGDEDGEGSDDDSEGDGQGSGEDQSNGQNQGQGDGSNHLRTPQQNGKSPSEIKQMESEVKSQLAQAATVAKQAGKLPAELEKLVNQALKPKVDWKKALREFVQETAKTDYTFRRPNRRTMVHDMYLPSLTGNEIPPFLLIFDTSGSIYHSKDTCEIFASEINGIIEELSPAQVVVAYADTRVVDHTVLEQGEPLDLKLKGGGGTDFEQPMQWANEFEDVEFAGVIYFTDLYTNNFGNCEKPTLWAVYDNPDPTPPPYGQVVPIEN